jgi:hypothetical protein
MGTYTPHTTGLVGHVATLLGAIQTPAWRTNIGTNVSTEREQALDTEAPFCAVMLVGWESTAEGTAVRRDCELLVEATIAAGAADAEAQARLVAEDIFERFRSGSTTTLASGVEAVIRPSDSAAIERPDGAAAITVRLTLRAEIYELF